MNRFSMIILVAAMVGIAACGTTPCTTEEPYLEARPGKPLVVPEGLDVPREDRRMVIPEGSGRVHPDLRGRIVEGPDGTTRCLTEPPPMREAD